MNRGAECIYSLGENVAEEDYVYKREDGHCILYIEVIRKT